LNIGLGRIDIARQAGRENGKKNTLT
jgi:hypothetical protein